MLFLLRSLVSCLVAQLVPRAAAATTTPDYLDLAQRMVQSDLGRTQGLNLGPESTDFLELGVFQYALRRAINASTNATQRQSWRQALNTSVVSAIPALLNTSRTVAYPLDRFSVGSSLILLHQETDDPSLLPAITDLQSSALLQPRNADSSLWYYDDIANLTAYQNLSYLDGMASYPRFAVLTSQLPGVPSLTPSSATNPTTSSTAGNNTWTADALLQFDLLYDACVQKPSGLLTHGFDALKRHPWANATTGASPIVWGRSLAWYTLGLVTIVDNNRDEGTTGTATLPSSSSSSSSALPTSLLPSPSSLPVAANTPGVIPTGPTSITAPTDPFQQMYSNVSIPQVIAAEKSFQSTGKYGVWQVVDRPGAAGNFVEASASFLTVYNLLVGARLGLYGLFPGLTNRTVTVARGMYAEALADFLIDNGANGTLSLNGTSAVASLAGAGVNYTYYVTRPTVLNHLFGTSAFVLASLEMGRLGS